MIPHVKNEIQKSIEYLMTTDRGILVAENLVAMLDGKQAGAGKILVNHVLKLLRYAQEGYSTEILTTIRDTPPNTPFKTAKMDEDL